VNLGAYLVAVGSYVQIEAVFTRRAAGTRARPPHFPGAFYRRLRRLNMGHSDDGQQEDLLHSESVALKGFSTGLSCHDRTALVR